MSTAQITSAGGFAELPSGHSSFQTIDPMVDDLLWLGYEAAFPASWMAQPAVGDEAPLAA